MQCELFSCPGLTVHRVTPRLRDGISIVKRAVLLQVWFQNRRAKFRRNERSILAQRTQLQQFAAASASRKCTSSSPSRLIDDFHHHQLHHHRQPQQQQQQCMVESSAVTQSGSTTTSWQAGRHYAQSAGQTATSGADLLYSTTATAAAPGAVSTDSVVLQQQSVATSLSDVDDRLQTTAAVVRQRVRYFTTAYTTDGRADVTPSRLVSAQSFIS